MRCITFRNAFWQTTGPSIPLGGWRQYPQPQPMIKVSGGSCEAPRTRRYRRRVGWYPPPHPTRTEIAIWMFCSPILQFLAVGHCRNHLLSSTSSKILNLALEFRRYLPEFQRCNYFRFWGTYPYFQLSVAVLLTCQDYFTSTRTHGLIPQIYHWHFNCTLA